MMIDFPTGVLFLTNKSGDFIANESRVCCVCKERTKWFRNENGSSKCITCAGGERSKKGEST